MRTGGDVKALIVALALLAGPAAARDSLGVFENWGAFRDAQPPRCFAIAEPVRKAERAPWRPFASVAFWPTRGARNQVNIRLSRAKGPAARVMLSIGDRNFDLLAGGADAWAPDPRTDAAIVAAMRSGTSMSIATRTATGAYFIDVYRLRGAATAIDAAALGCAGRR